MADTTSNSKRFQKAHLQTLRHFTLIYHLMSISLYVAKADGDREVLDNVTAEMAREVYVKMDWDAEMATVQAAEAAGQDVFLPEFGLTDDAERNLAVSPVDSNTVSFYVQYPDRVAGVQNFPKDEVAAVIGAFCDGNDDAIGAFVARNTPAPKKDALHELSDADFRATIVRPMVRLRDEQSYRQVPLRNYLGDCITAHSLPATLDTIELTDIYVAGDKRHSHIHFHYGDPNTALVIVTRHDPDDDSDGILGHCFVSGPAGYYAN
jgi:hypothetical protein